MIQKKTDIILNLQVLTIRISKYKLLTMQYKRDISDKIKKLSTQFPAIVLTGARQVGKTTLLKSLFPQHNYISLDLPSQAESAETEPETFLRENPTPLIIDEVQYAPKLFRYIKNHIDQNRHDMGAYLLTGSQKFSLMKEVSESLAGRAAILELECLSLSEVGKQSSWIDVLVRGFYPELWRQPELNPKDFFASYVATYLERDVRQILNVSSLRDFERLLRSCASRSGQLLNNTDIAREVGVTGKTVREWMSVLQSSNQVFFLEPYFENMGKRMVKSPKLYLHDPGLLCFLLGLDSNSLPKSPLLGAVWETFIYAELRKRVAITDSHGRSLWFYRDAQGREVDFLDIHDGKINVLEAKWAEMPDKKWVTLIKEVQTILMKSKTYQVGEGRIICRTQAQHQQNSVQFLNPNHVF